MFGIGANEIAIILLFGFLIFGPDKLPALAKTTGRFIAKFRSAQEEMSKVIREEVYDPVMANQTAASESVPANPAAKVSRKIEEEADEAERTESFSERKVRYDRERAARKAAEAKRMREEATGQTEPAKQGKGEHEQQPAKRLNEQSAKQSPIRPAKAAESDQPEQPVQPIKSKEADRQTKAAKAEDFAMSTVLPEIQTINNANPSLADELYGVIHTAKQPTRKTAERQVQQDVERPTPQAVQRAIAAKKAEAAKRAACGRKGV